MNIKLFKDKKPNFNKLIFFGITPTYSTRCLKSIISHYITGNKLYEIMKHNRISNLVWIDSRDYIFRYRIHKIPTRPNIIAKYIRKKPNRTNHRYRYYNYIKLEKSGIEVLGNLHDKSNRNYLTNKKLKKICKWNGLKGYSNLNKKDLIKLLIKL